MSTSVHNILSAEYLPVLDELNRIVKASGTPLEGNIFYEHHEPSPGYDNLAWYFEAKRNNFSLICRQNSCLLEIGLNAGHSALVALSQGIEYHGVDICIHPYTRPAAAYLKQKFPDRFYFYEGDSMQVLPQMRTQYPHLRFDLLHIDGHHGVEFCQADTENAAAMALNNAWVLVDDTDMPDIRLFFDTRVQQGYFQNTKPDGWTATPHHDIGKLA